jgi:hypothetical protein
MLEEDAGICDNWLDEQAVFQDELLMTEAEIL